VDIYHFEKAQVFISYTSDDRALVANFVDRLNDDAITAAAVLWYDRNLTPAREWDDEIMTRLREADVFLVLASPKYFQSQYSIERELPLIRQRANGIPGQSTLLPTEQPPTHTPVRVIRLRAFDEPRPEIEDLNIWPNGSRTLEIVSPDGPELNELRSWLKVEICKALVRRHADRYHDRSREEEIKWQEENQVFDRRMDDLAHLHHELGVSVTNRVRVAFGSVGGFLLGAASGLAIKSWLITGALGGFFRPVLFFALLGFVFGMVKPCLRAAEMMLEAFQGRGPDGNFWSDLGGNLMMTPFVALNSLFHLVVLGGILGLPLGAVLSTWGWSVDIGLVGSAAIGGILCFIPGVDFAFSFRRKQLKVFTDVQHLYQPPVIDPLPPASYRIGQPASPEVDKPIDTAPLTSQRSSQSRAASEVAPEPEQESEEESEEESEDSHYFPRTVEDVTPKLTVVASAARSEETSQLLAALQADYCDDVFRISVVTDIDPEAQKLDHWKQALSRDGRCVVIMTTDLLRTPVPGVIAEALARRSSAEWHKVYPVLVDVDLPMTSPLMDVQGLPTGHLCVQNWPVREKAWTNVSRNLLGDEISGFLISLSWYLEHLVFQERVAQLQEKIPQSYLENNDLLSRYRFEFALSEYQRELMGGEWLVDPKHDLSRFPFKHKSWYWSLGSVVGWIMAGAVCLGFGRAFAAWANGATDLRSGWIGHVVPMFALTLVLTYFVFRETLGYARRRLSKFSHESDTGGVVLFLLGAWLRVSSVKRRPIVDRVTRLMLLPVALLAVITVVALSLSPHGYAFGYKIGVAVGLACYVLTRYRVPTVVLWRRTPPTPYNKVVKRKGLKWTICIPREHHSESQRDQIGGTRSPQPRLIESYYEELSISVWMVLRALVEVVFITAVAIIGAALLFVLGVPPLLAFWFALSFMSFSVSFLGSLPFMYQGWKAGISLWEEWRAFRFVILRRVFRMHMCILLGVVAIGTLKGFGIFGDTVYDLLFIAVVGGIPFGARLYHQVLQTSHSHYPDPMER